MWTGPRAALSREPGSCGRSISTTAAAPLDQKGFPRVPPVSAILDPNQANQELWRNEVPAMKDESGTSTQRRRVRADVRQALLRSSFAHLYPSIAPGEWQPAAV